MRQLKDMHVFWSTEDDGAQRLAASILSILLVGGLTQDFWPQSQRLYKRKGTNWIPALPPGLQGVKGGSEVTALILIYIPGNTRDSAALPDDRLLLYVSWMRTNRRHHLRGLSHMG